MPTPGMGAVGRTLLFGALKSMLEQVKNRSCGKSGIYFAYDNVKFGTKKQNAIG